MSVTYTIKEFESLTKISSHNLRYFDKIDLLKPHRDSNGYRMYSLPQVAIAEMIIILQKAKVPNAEIKLLLDDYTSAQTINKLRSSQSVLFNYIEELQAAYQVLTGHIANLEKIDFIKQKLNKPFIEDREAMVVGSISLKTDNIVEFFERVGQISENNSWYLVHDYGFLLDKDEVRKTGYPLLVMYCNTPATIKEAPYVLNAGRYMSNYCSGSLENNGKVYELMQHAKECGYKIKNPILIENVSGPAIETEKKDFIIKIMIPIEN